MAMKKACSFCGRAERDVPLLITGVNGFICSDCAQQAYRIVKDSLPVEHKEKDDLGFVLSLDAEEFGRSEVFAVGRSRRYEFGAQPVDEFLLDGPVDAECGIVEQHGLFRMGC